jgi:hypothetical protein
MPRDGYSKLLKKFDKHLAELEQSGVDPISLTPQHPIEKKFQAYIDYDRDMIYIPTHYYGSDMDEARYQAVEFILTLQREVRHNESASRLKYIAF